MALIPSLPITLQNGTTADATQVMANFNAIVSAVNANAANAGINTNITQLQGLTVAVAVNQGGTGSQILTPNGVLLGEGTGPVNAVAPGTTGQVLTSNGPGQDPSYQTGVLSGMGLWWPGTTAPTGYAEANGQSTTGMSATIISLYGANLPDMRGVFPRGWDHGRGLDPNNPAILAYVADEFKEHNHTTTENPHSHGTGMWSNSVVNGGGGTIMGSAQPTRNETFQTDTAVTGLTINNTGGAETAPKYIAWMFVIKL